MIYQSISLRKFKWPFLGVLVTILCMVNCHPSYANTSDSYFNMISFQTQEFSLTRKLGNPIKPEALGIKLEANIPEKIYLQNQLIRSSVYLRDIARYLGSNWPIFISFADAKTGKIKYQITDFQESKSDWKILTAGQTLKLMTQELQVLNNSQTQPLIDFLVKDSLTNDYRIMSRVPLSSYCNFLLDYILKERTIFSDPHSTVPKMPNISYITKTKTITFFSQRLCINVCQFLNK